MVESSLFVFFSCFYIWRNVYSYVVFFVDNNRNWNIHIDGEKKTIYTVRINKGLQKLKTTKEKKSFICLTRLNKIFLNKKNYACIGNTLHTHKNNYKLEYIIFNNEPLKILTCIHI